MPDSHRQKQYEERIKLADDVHTIKVENLTNDIKYVRTFISAFLSFRFRQYDIYFIHPFFKNLKFFFSVFFSVEDLNNIFSEFGTISSIYYPTDLKTLKSKNFAFIRYLREDDAVSAMDSLQGIPIGTYVRLCLFVCLLVC